LGFGVSGGSDRLRPLRHRDLAFGLLCRTQRSLQLGPAHERVVTFAGFNLDLDLRDGPRSNAAFSSGRRTSAQGQFDFWIGMGVRALRCSRSWRPSRSYHTQTDCVPGVVGLEPRNPGPNYLFESLPRGDAHSLRRWALPNRNKVVTVVRSVEIWAHSAPGRNWP
jgi:hypothetical protein